MAVAFCCHPPSCHPCVLLIVMLVGIILITVGVSVAVDMVLLLPSLLAALPRPFILSFAPAGCCLLPLSPYCLALPSCPLVAPSGCCVLHCISGHIVLCRPLGLSLRQLVVACCMPLLPSLVGLHRPLVLLLCRLVVVCQVTSVAYCIAPSSHPLVDCIASVVLSCCATLLFCPCTSWLLLLALPLLPYCLAPPSRPLHAPAGCCMSPMLPYRLAPPSHPLIALAGCCCLHCLCCHIVLRHPLVLWTCRLVVACQVSSCCPLSPLARVRMLTAVAQR